MNNQWGCREREPQIYPNGNGNVEKLIFKIESPWGLERAKALVQGRTTKLFTNSLFLRAQRGMERQQKQIKMAAGLCAISSPKQTFFFP